MSSGRSVGGEPARENFGRLADGTEIEIVTLSGAGGMQLRVMTLGAAVQTLTAPDRAGRFENVVLNYDALAPYVGRPEYFGAAMGRFANRIGGAAFSLDGARHQLEANEGANILHGGDRGFDKQVWRIEAFAGGETPRATFSYVSADGEAGFPGRLTARVSYELTVDNALAISFEAACDKPTVANLTNHSFFNLAGAASGADILGHELMIAADSYTPAGDGLIPTGEIRAVADTPLDFRDAQRVGARIEASAELVALGGYDHNFALQGGKTGAPKLAARLHDPVSGRVMELSTTEPGLQLYTGQKLGAFAGATPAVYRAYRGLALEPQLFPDAPNKPQFASARLDPGQTYRHVSVYRFSAI